MKLGLFADSCLRLLTGFEYSKSEVGVDRRDIQSVLNDAIGQAAQMCFWESYKIGNRGNIDPGFLTTFENVPVLFSTPRNAWYSDLPSLPIAMESGLGLYEIAPMRDQSSAFVPVVAGSPGLFKGLAAEFLFGESGFRQESGKVWYSNYNFTPVENRVMLMNIVADVSTLSMDDEIHIPANYLSQVRQYVLQAVGGALQIPPDATIDQDKDKNNIPRQ